MNDGFTITKGHDRLSLQYSEGHFRALIWSSEVGGEWHCRVVITQADFERDIDRERWVSDLHSFDPVAGHAVIKVGEMEMPDNEGGHGGFRRVIYSWRKWDLLANREVRVLRICEDPCEQYENPAKIHKAIVEYDVNAVTIDCNCEDWDGCLYTSLYSKQRVELRNLHSSYERFMNQLADHYCMQFFGEFAKNRGVFKRRV